MKEKILEYLQIWEKRCYFEGIPDEAPKELEGKTEEDALIAYLQGLGVNRRYIMVDEVVAK